MQWCVAAYDEVGDQEQEIMYAPVAGNRIELDASEQKGGDKSTGTK